LFENYVYDIIFLYLGGINMGNFCGKCGNKIEKDTSFCVNCGNPVKEDTKKEIKKETKNNTVEKDTDYVPQRNGWAIAGFILSFHVPILGIIFSIIGLRNSSRINGVGRGLTIAGIIVSSFVFVMRLVLYLYYIYYFFEVAMGV
jgi:hypothetical protein